MSRPSPPKLDVARPPVRFALTQEHACNIEAACGVKLNDRAIGDLGEVLETYLASVMADAKAPTIEAAEKRLNKMRSLASELCEAISTESDDPVERTLRYRLREDFAYLDNIVILLSYVLRKFLDATAVVHENVVVRRNWPEHDSKRQLANELDIIWRRRLDQNRTTISGGDQKGSPFIEFVLAATACLPSNWPWRPTGTSKICNRHAFAKAVGRSLNRPLDR